MWSYDGTARPFAEVVQEDADRATVVVCVGTCSAYGGIPAAGPNPTGISSIASVTGKSTINIPGCPPHPDWMVWGIVQILLGNNIPLDSQSRPGRRTCA